MKRLNFKQLFKGSCLFAALTLYSMAVMAQTKTPAKPAIPGTATTTATAAPVAAKGAQSYIETFFKKYKSSPDSAIDYIFGTNPLFARNSSQISALKLKIDSLQIALGKFTGKELISQRSSSPSLIIYSYLVKHEEQPIRFTFILYKAKNDWTLYRFNFDDAMDQELFEAVKINNKR